MAVKLFLGGTCNDSKWREKFISIIDNKGIFKLFIKILLLLKLKIASGIISKLIF